MSAVVVIPARYGSTRFPAKMLAAETGRPLVQHVVDRVRASALSEAGAEEQMLAFLERYIAPGTSPMCGNSVHQDRRFLAKHMPRLEGYFHYRNLDVSTLKELARRWKPEIMSGLAKHGKHEALADIYESIEELRYYREHFIKP